ncbi:ribosome rescue GTPase HflX [Spongiibacter marinus]|uniref:ribosome rescue GTPase HflX n=1 Tax=Spongiibacter marinus TaxID=354246 RepID=UPI001960380B|nr:ribosome rescue GTPase HflX [Spongiibacter marinus]MBM7423523.1 GTP-binding protein HflX [Spongiibacter marinus]
MLFERPNSGERAILVHLNLNSEDEREDADEFVQLVTSAGGDPVAFITGQRQHPDPRSFVGSGKLAEIRQALQDHDGELVLFNHALSPSQERNIERELQCRVLDRTGLILDIFAQRARTHEGKLQVELAQLEHMSTRLIRGWTHLERQKGGIGLRGPGETQLETDRRLLRARIKSIQSRLSKVRRQRDQARRARQRADIPAVSLVGYTNAGKSTLFNVLTESKVYAADQLFATLDPTLRRIQVDDVGPVVLADTVGFIRHLPHKLVEAFRATLEEATLADLLVHVVDCADPERSDNVRQVKNVLEEIGADSIPVLEVYNKTDLLGTTPRIERNEHGDVTRVWLSAQRQQGLELLGDALAEILSGDIVEPELVLNASDGRLRARLYQLNAIQSEQLDEAGRFHLKLRLPSVDWQRFLAAESLSEASLNIQQSSDEMSPTRR